MVIYFFFRILSLAWRDLFRLLLLLLTSVCCRLFLFLLLIVTCIICCVCLFSLRVVTFVVACVFARWETGVFLSLSRLFSLSLDSEVD